MKYKGTLIVVKDCNKAFRFYHDMFGLELIRDNDENGNPIYENTRQYAILKKEWENK